MISPEALAEALGQFAPTPEQAEVIAAPLQPALVLAGAGAGKTETMASRVVFLVANELVSPDAVIGLTFTRKAAQQLTVRIRQRLAMLAGSELVMTIDPAGGLRERIANAEPRISTYHAYAGELIAQYGLLLPVEPDAVLLSEAELWQLAHRVVAGYDGPLDGVSSPASLTDQVLRLSAEMAEHLVEADELALHAEQMLTLVEQLPQGPRQRGPGPTQWLVDRAAKQQARLHLLPLVEALHAELRRAGALDFGAQMSLAAQLAASRPEVRDGERARYSAVLLDEYQDTGHSQRVLLRSLFGAPEGARAEGGALAVTAVGDPMQSIYGWRGASAANLPRFVTDFPSADGSPAQVLQLLTSWRNPPEALALANAVAEPLRASSVPVGTLTARPGAAPGDVRMLMAETVEAEREWIAGVIADAYAQARAAGRALPTVAVLVRKNAAAGPLAEVLRAHGLPVEVVGVGGLLSTPEIVDIVSMLQAVADPSASPAALRLLTGARLRLGAADLRALAARARHLGPRRGPRPESPADADALTEALVAAAARDGAEDAGLLDAVADPGAPEAYSAAGYQRIKRLAADLARVRALVGAPLVEVVAEVKRVLGLDIEVAARRDATGAGRGDEQLEAFDAVVADFEAHGRGTLPALLDYLSVAASREAGLEAAQVQVAADRVQILTVHAAKGLEWEVVAVPHLVERVFPSAVAVSSWVGSAAELPIEFRGDRATGDGEGLPTVDYAAITDRKELQDAWTANGRAMGERRDAEERRLFYVAVTRTERVLALSGYRWSESDTKPRAASVFLDELHERVAAEPRLATVDGWEPMPEEDAENPLAAEPIETAWPTDPLEARGEAVRAGAAQVREAIAAGEAPEAASAEPAAGSAEASWAAEADALLAEREARAAGPAPAELPADLSVSALVELRADPQGYFQRRARPMPVAPNLVARRGTAFHAWVERRFGGTGLLDYDELPGAADEGAAPDADLDELIAAYQRSAWAGRTPIEVEVPFEAVIADRLVRGRIDAVFRDSDGGYTVLDWKTGAVPDAARRPALDLQLATYRLAWARLAGVEPTRVRAVFHYVRPDVTLEPEHLADADELAALLSEQGARYAASEWTSTT